MGTGNADVGTRKWKSRIGVPRRLEIQDVESRTVDKARAAVRSFALDTDTPADLG